ncbi:hypothetical protein DNTS_030131 [Danionella cerebrum]|uniref:HMG box domain-containing protein n=1 Tax=Danionella cerebrum TaxID=2873325 RepID=A0A553QMV5_9TELE|nr:hypothetical protein DNTS_030131 [Danionella translucida]
METICGEMEVESYTILELPSPKKKRKRKCSVESSDKPKKPRSAYLLYYYDVHQSVQQEHPQMPQSEINKCISDSWKRLNVADRGFYLERARMERDGLDPSSQSAASTSSSSQDIPGFRKILPRANYVLQPKSSSGSERVQVNQEDGGARKVELSEQCIAIEALTKDSNLTPSGSEGVTSLFLDAHSTTAALLEKKAEPQASYGEVTMVIENGMESGALMNQIKVDATHLVAILPQSQGIIESKVTKPPNPIMMFPVMSNVNPEPKPCLKLPIKYTRRGRGNCNTPGCVFSYVTRHKPPKCPDCGQHLGGKWVPPPKRSSAKDSDSTSGEHTEKPKPPDEPLDPKHTEHTANSEMIQTNSSDQAQDGGVAPVRRAAYKKKEPVQKTPEDHDVSKSVENTAALSVAGAQIQFMVQEKQRRRIRTILPAPSQNLKPIEHVSALKASTIKQLGHMISPSASDQKPVPVSSNQYIITDNGVKILSSLPLKNTMGSSLALGLSTARGRGRCKNPACDYVYKNRHKPQRCPICDWELSTKPVKRKQLTSSAEEDVSTLLPESLSPSLKEQQRLSTISLIRSSLQFPESQNELQNVFDSIQHLNRMETGDNEETNKWPSIFESSATHCGLCQSPLSKGDLRSAGVLATDGAIASSRLFNVGNQLLVTVDLFFKMRNRIRLGDEPAQAALSIISHSQRLTDPVLNSEDESRLQDLLCSGYWAFECLTVRDYNDMICGVCGVAPKLEFAQRDTSSVLMLKNLEFTWPDFSAGDAADEVQVDEFWMMMENEALEQGAFPSCVPITRFDASIIAPFIPPLMRNTSVINTEKDKITKASQLSGDPSVLVRLIHEEPLVPDQLEQCSDEKLQDVLEKCGVPAQAHMDRDSLLASVSSLYSNTQNSLWTGAQPKALMTAGKISKVCPHQVVCGSKYLVRRESARDHLDLLLSSRLWPLVYVSDCAQQVALCTELSCPQLASLMWGKNQGCISDPTAEESLQVVSCSELQDQPVSLDPTATDSNPNLHPLTKSPSRWLVCPSSRPDAQHYSISHCKELQPYASLAKKICEDKPLKKPLVFHNAAYYYLYNRLMDFQRSREVVNQQMVEVLNMCQPGEVLMIRDSLYRLGVAQIDSSPQGPEEEEVVIEEVLLL